MKSFVRSAGQRGMEKLSTGISGLDAILGECFTRGTSILLLEDENSRIHSTILKVFLSEGIYNQESTLAVVKEGGDVEVYDTGSSMEQENEDRMVIAWRYSKLSLGRPAFKFNLSKKKRFDGILLSGKKATLESILDIAREERELRIAVFSLGSPAWRLSGYEEKKMMRFLFELRRLSRINNHIYMVSAPGFMMPDANFSLYFDTVAEFDSNIFSRFCPNYNGVLEFKKIGGYGCLRINSLESLKYGVKIRKESICVEKVAMPPEDVKPPGNSCIQDKTF
ncbi:hypothetical protein EROM_040770 [Encephalitozoon romaleae SJ-2008]|uniref:Elongator complex protein 4 n=1 Tax=Encephalitozoon romaleae (strain SJ-2008) TaxID=1178016 RepID=I7AE06_ENCRO|nr:hypothetical protein EROM_040770 [Encephalitozoon romaleae SJ-2008]AFN82845.1 hypothetical protein EROM_040770 [Encephalitozoon romaleae SJ-2008]